MNVFSSRRNALAAFGMLVGSFTIGCAEPEGLTKPEPPQPAIEKPTESIIGKTTQDIGVYDPNDVNVVEANLEVAPDSGLLDAYSGSYKYATATISQQAVERSLQLFYAVNERYPRDHAEFMEEIVKKGNLQFPVLPGARKYQYDVENHVLRVVENRPPQP